MVQTLFKLDQVSYKALLALFPSGPGGKESGSWF
jgi:hypothetical protein